MSEIEQKLRKAVRTLTAMLRENCWAGIGEKLSSDPDISALEREISKIIALIAIEVTTGSVSDIPSIDAKGEPIDCTPGKLPTLMCRKCGVNRLMEPCPQLSDCGSIAIAQQNPANAAALSKIDPNDDWVAEYNRKIVALGATTTWQS